MLLHKRVALALKNAIKATLPNKFLLNRSVRIALENGEPELKIVACLCRRSEISMDVGANWGVYSFLLSRYSDHVIAVEPHPILADRLKRLLPASVTVLNVAASNQDGYSEFHIPMSNGKEIDTRCSLQADVNPEFTTRTIRVKKRRLDGLPLGGRKVAVIKMDVEGHELRALQGLVGILEQSKPSIIVESEARHNAGAPFNVFDLLLSYGYEGYFIYRSNLRPISEFSVETFQVETAAKSAFSERSPDYVNNFIFVHSSCNAVLDGVRQVFPSVTPTSKR